jgi:tetratricopeptide (TPR) repeat protein
MKAEHRHQLQTNELADRMGRFLQGMKSAPKTTSTLLWVFVLLALAVIAVWQYAANATVKDRSALWTSVDDATHNPTTAGLDGLEVIESKNPGTLAGRAAGFELARWKLQQGMGFLARDDRSRAAGLLKDARELYRKLLPQAIENPPLAQEALMGMATAEESLAVAPATPGQTAEAAKTEEAKGEEQGGKLEKALEYYQELAKKYPDSVLGKKAAKRAEELEQQTSRSQIDQFYAEVSQKAAPKFGTPAKPK